MISDVIIFGYGEMTSRLIDNFLENSKTVICITDNLEMLQGNRNSKLEVISYDKVTSKNITVLSTIFSWRNSEKLLKKNKHLISWIESESFQSKKSLFLSSASIYKDINKPVTESDKNLANDIKSNEKYNLEKLLTHLMKQKRTNHINLRISNVYGSNLQYGLINELNKSVRFEMEVSLFRNLDLVRDYIHLNDVIHAVNELIKLDFKSNSLNVSTGVGTTIREVLEIFATYGFQFSRYNFLEMPINTKFYSILDCRKLENIISWQPIKIQDGIADLDAFRSV
jgi:nucleoside-diphosphate-sugar epimerase